LAFLYKRLDIVDLFVECNNQYNLYKLSELTNSNNTISNYFMPSPDIMIGAIMSKEINCVIYCNNLLKSLYVKEHNLDTLLNSNAIAHAVKFNLISILHYLLTESYKINAEAISYGSIFNSVESLEIILSDLYDESYLNAEQINFFINSDTLNSAIIYDNVNCLKILIKYGQIQLTKANMICCFENDSFKCITYICSLVNKEIISGAYNEIDQKILTNEIKEYLIKNNLVKLT
jgi:hypothetical protein